MVPENLEYSMQLLDPRTDLYRLDWTPSTDVRLAGMWVPGIVTDESGDDFLGLRGFSDFIGGMTHTVSPFCGFRSLQTTLRGDPPHLFAEYSNHDWFEPFQYDDSGDRPTITFDSGRLIRDGDGLHWFDADERWVLHGETISQVFVLHVPRQQGIDDEVYYRHELLRAQGTVNGTPVRGYLHQDYAYGPPGMTYTQLPIARQLEGMWVSWIHRYADGGTGGGCFWQGRDGADFRPGYVLRGGVTTAHDDVDARLGFDDGVPHALHVAVDGDTFDFELRSRSGPLHFVGRLVGSSSGRAIADSWCWIEYADGMLTPEILDLTGQRFAQVWARGDR